MFALCKEAVSCSAGLTAAKSQRKIGSNTTWRNRCKSDSCTVAVSSCVISACLQFCFTVLSPVFYNLYWKAAKTAGLDFIFNLWEMLSAQNIP